MKRIARITAAVLSGLMLVSLSACSFGGEQSSAELGTNESSKTAEKKSANGDKAENKSNDSQKTEDESQTPSTASETAAPGADEQQKLIKTAQQMVLDNKSENAVYNYLVVDNGVASDVAQTWINGMDVDWNDVAYKRYVQIAQQDTSLTGLQIQDRMASEEGFTPDQIVYAADNAVKNGETPEQRVD